MQRILIAIVILLGWSQIAAVAQESQSSSITGSETQPIELDRSSQVWGLEPDESERLEVLIEQQSPFSDVDALTPWEILGIGAETHSERILYAEKYLSAMSAHQNKSLEWSVAVATVLQERDYASALKSSAVIGQYLESKGYNGVIDNSRKKVSTTSAKPARAHLFIDSNCVKCDSLLTQAQILLERNEIEGIDVIFGAQFDRGQIIDWAGSKSIEVEQLEKKLVTLNLISPAWKAELRGRDMPILINTSTGNEY